MNFNKGDELNRTMYRPQVKKKATLDEANDDQEPIRSVVNNDDRILTQMRTYWQKEIAQSRPSNTEYYEQHQAPNSSHSNSDYKRRVQQRSVNRDNSWREEREMLIA